MLRVHHLSCGTMCPVGGKFMDGFSHGLTSHLACHCLAIETNEGLVLVDTGFGCEDINHPYQRLSPFFLNFNRIQLEQEKTARIQIQKLGFKREDVRHIVLTHLDFDHAGGLSDFPNAKVHLMDDELTAARNPKTWLDRNRYCSNQWIHERHWTTYSAQGEKWFDFDSVRDLEGLPPEILLIPLVGHTFGHAGVAVQTDKGWLLHAGDAYFYRGEMDLHRYHCTPGLRFYQKMMEVDRKSRLKNQKRLRALIQQHTQEVKIFSAHDALELEQFQRAEKVEKTRTSSNLEGSFYEQNLNSTSTQPPDLDASH
jgi:glyoxylase-like metal-dependent hydrolase (beta-lactamase superfamily II)